MDRVAEELNGRPRQTLGWKNPTEALMGFFRGSCGHDRLIPPTDVVKSLRI